MRLLIAIFFLFNFLATWANMASPVRPGTYSSSAFSSRDIDILSETIIIKPASDFKTADFSIEYHIRTDTSGTQVPLLFHAVDYQGDFRVWLDGQEIAVIPLPDEFIQPGTALNNKFPALSATEMPEYIYWGKGSGRRYKPDDFKFFEADLVRGEHRIRVDYIANVWTDRSGWVKDYSFRYSLSPARFWRSFGSLDIQLDTSLFSGKLQTNLGSPASREDSRIIWHFSKLPADYIGISHSPLVGSFALMLIGLGPERMTVIFAILLILMHILLVKRFRKRHPQKSFSWVLLLGCIFVPLLVLLTYPVVFDIIDNAIGPEAGRYHGYNFLVIGLYPFLLPVYALVMWLIDRRFKSRQVN